MNGARAAAAALGLVALLTACGGESDSPSDSGPLAIADLAAQAGCTSHTVDPEPQLYVREQATCTGGPADAKTIYTFAETQQRDDWLEIAKGFGGIYLVGDGWIVDTGTAEVAEATKAVAGGEVR